MILGRYVQQSTERRKRLLDYTDWLEDGETISSVSATAVPDAEDAAALVVSGIVIDPDGKKFAYFVEDGEDTVEYTVNFSVTTSLGQIREDEVVFEIEDL
jgi:hypothetical protein